MTPPCPRTERDESADSGHSHPHLTPPPQTSLDRATHACQRQLLFFQYRGCTQCGVIDIRAPAAAGLVAEGMTGSRNRLTWRRREEQDAGHISLFSIGSTTRLSVRCAFQGAATTTTILGFTDTVLGWCAMLAEGVGAAEAGESGAV